MIEIRKYNNSDEEGIRELFSKCFGKEMSREEWAWKYKNSPWGSAAIVAVDGNNVIAHYGGIKMKFIFRDKLLNAYQFCDVMTHPEYRGFYVSKSPIIVKLGEMFYKENEMDFAFGFPSVRHARLQSLRLGGEGYRFVKLYKKVTTRGHFGSFFLKIEDDWNYFHNYGIQQEYFERREQVFKLIKNNTYIKWRYCQSPIKKYRLLVSKKYNILKGFAVVSLNERWLEILDIFVKDISSLKDLIVSIEKYTFDKSGMIEGIKAWFHPSEKINSILEKLGFESEDNIPIAFKSVNKECGITSDVFYDNYYYRMGDYDAS